MTVERDFKKNATGKLNKYVVAFLLFVSILGMATLTYKLLDGRVLTQLNSILHRFILLIASILLIPHFSKPTQPTNTIKNLTGRDYGWILLVISLFAINNLLSPVLGTAFEYTSIFGLTLFQITISSISEEFLYRGLIQSHIDKDNMGNTSKISPGNYFATALMVITHLGFFTIMSPAFAISSLLLVGIFSLVVGHLKSKTNGLWVPIALHLTANYIHFLIQSLQK